MKIEYSLMEDMWRLFGFLALVLFLLFDPLGIIPADVLAQGSGATSVQNNSPYQHIINTLVKLFILAVLVEIALAVLFRWRVFLRHAEGRGWKVPIAFVVSLAIVIAHKIDLPGEVVSALGDTSTGGKEVGYAISALIIAGGSSSVNSIFESLGWRNPLVQQQKAEQERQKTQGRLWVQVTRPAGSTSEGQPLIVNVDSVSVGTIPPDQHRFGGQNGYMIVPGSHTIDVTWTDQGGNQKKASKQVVVAGGSTISETFMLS
jgi:hypothetical protein